MPSSKSQFMQRCVADVAGQGKPLGRAFAICTAQAQKSKYTKPGSATLTAKGKGRERQFAQAPDRAAKGRAYERAVQADQQEEQTMQAILKRLQEARMSGRMEDPVFSIRVLAVETPSGRSWRKNIQVTFDEVMATLGAVDAMYADQPAFKSDLQERERRALVERLDKALESAENVVGAMRSLMRRD